MAKPKNPLLSLCAQGTIGDALTFQKRGRGTIARKMPIPANPRSLAQTYHRWLYEDYAYLWRQQSEATKQEYRSEGAKRHLTGFSHWMSYQLTYLPDIAGCWHLDEYTGAIAYDYSRNANHAVIIGATPTTGRIDRALSFDGINDTVNMGNDPSLDVLSYTQVLFLNPHIDLDATIATTPFIWSKTGTFYFFYNVGKLYAALFDGGNVWRTVEAIINLPKDTWHHIAVTYDLSTEDFILYAHGVQIALIPNIVGRTTSATNLYLCSQLAAASWLNARADHCILYNRALDPAEILRHSLRRYPL